MMHAAVIVAPKLVKLDQVATPRPDAHEVLVRLEGCGVCTSTLPLWEGRPWFSYPLNPGQGGHEGWGYIQQTGRQVRDVSPGDRVAFLSGNAYAEYDVTRSDAVVKLPPALDGIPFPGEPLGCAMNIFRRSDVVAGQTVAIVGIGFLGALLTQLAARAGARVIAISRRPFALHVAREMGATEVIPLQDLSEVVQTVKRLTVEQGCERVIEAIGNQQGLDLATELTRERGRLVIAGYHQDGLRQVNMQLWNWRGLDVINAHERDPQVYVEGIQLAVDAVSHSIINPTPLYTPFPLARLGDAFEMIAARPDGFMKALVLP